ncbi:MAG: tail protein X [Nitrospinae bacterium]|nr:tail protein X [Nitrospinota bacterium]
MKYRTIQNDRWDQISFKFYGHPDYYKEIIKANSYLSDVIKRSPLLPAGIELEIPQLEVSSIYPEELPPWKR